MRVSKFIPEEILRRDYKVLEENEFMNNIELIKEIYIDFLVNFKNNLSYQSIERLLLHYNGWRMGCIETRHYSIIFREDGIFLEEKQVDGRF